MDSELAIWSFADAKEYERRWLASVREIAAGREPQRLIADALETWLTDRIQNHRCELVSKHNPSGHPLFSSPTDAPE